MARPERYFIGPNKRNQLNEVITRVTGMPASEGGVASPTRLQDAPPRFGLRLHRGTFTGSWSVGQVRPIAMTGGTATVNVTNYCVGVTQSTSQTATLNVIFGNVQGTVSVLEIQPHNDTSTTCVMTIAGVDLTQLPGYSAGTIQLLGHSAADLTTNATACATLTWYSITTCASS